MTVPKKYKPNNQTNLNKKKKKKKKKKCNQLNLI